MKQICDFSECTGCGTCVGACPKQCISMVPNAKYGGAIFPRIDADNCINCKKCISICPNNHPVVRNQPSECYASWNLNAEERTTSTSGGIGVAIAKIIIRNGGVVYGAAVKAAGIVEHIRVTDVKELHKLQKSKYVHSHVTKFIYQQLSEDKKAGRMILFTGTPCQIAGIKSYLKSYEKLYLVDIICHGVPPQQILKDHIKWKVKSEVSYFTTRNNEEYCLTLYDANQKILYQKNFPDDEYEYGFMYAMFFRSNCYSCKYASIERCSDVTIGDFWGLKDVNYPKKKVSEILINTKKGEILLSMCRQALFLEKRSVEEAVAGNAQLREPTKKNYLYPIFNSLYPYFGYRIAINVSYLKFRLMQPIYKIFKM